MARVLRMPDHGRLLVCTDLQGCMRDFKRMVEIFEQALITYQGDAHLIFTGDLIHGPHIEPEDWPDFLGEYYRDAPRSARHADRRQDLVGALRDRYRGAAIPARARRHDVDLRPRRDPRGIREDRRRTDHRIDELWPLRSQQGLLLARSHGEVSERPRPPRRAGDPALVSR